MNEKIIYRGESMIATWPVKIQEAQSITTCVIKGKTFNRIKYGSESDDWGANRQSCHDCAVIKGEYHVPGCDVERCPSCDGQMITCDCNDE